MPPLDGNAFPQAPELHLPDEVHMPLGVVHVIVSDVPVAEPLQLPMVPSPNVPFSETVLPDRLPDSLVPALHEIERPHPDCTTSQL